MPVVGLLMIVNSGKIAWHDTHMVRTGQPVLGTDCLRCRRHKMCKLPVYLIYLLMLSVTEYGKLFLYRLGQVFRSPEG